jgi:protocatechuate 3,4-dioxygenase alpha subunit
MIEIWQADASGRYASGGTGAFQGFGRLETDIQGRCVFETIRPGRVAAPDGGWQAPHINVLLFARGLLRHLHTRVYFEGDPANQRDPVLAMVPESRRGTLLARRSGGEPAEWQFDIVLQGAGETVFFDV